MQNLLVLALLGLICSAVLAQEPEEAPAQPDPLRLVLPPDLYAVQGQELSLYFDSVILTPNWRNFLYDVDCRIGRQDEDRWRVTPQEAEVGDHPLSLKVLDGANQIVTQGTTTVHVLPASAGAGKEFTLMCVGDSLTNASYYPLELFNLFATEGNARLRLVGTHYVRDSLPKEVVHEGYGGWTWAAFCSRWTDGADVRAKSPFMRLVDGTPTLDFQDYCDRVNNGVAPDFITILLGCNDTFGSSEEAIEQTIDTMFGWADKLLAEFQRVGPNTQIGILLLVPPAASQDAFGSNYKCGQTRWQYRRNQHRVVERMMERLSGRENQNIWLLPAHVNLDCVHNYPVSREQANARNPLEVLRQNNGVHPSAEGYYQIADTIYAWLKSRLAAGD